MTKLLWHSNAPWAPTGYGQQTALFAPILAERYDLAISAFYALEGAPIKWEGIPVLPGLGGDFGNGTLPEHARRYFNGDLRGGIVFMLADVWPFDVDMARQLNLICWTPIDHEPPPPKVLEFLVRSEAIVIAMSRFGESQLGRLDPLYVPHGIDTQVLRPLGRKTREQSFPDDAFVVGMVAANKGRPSRKGFAQALTAFARFAAEHANAYLYLHTVLDPAVGQGENVAQLCATLGIPKERMRIADQYTMMHNPYSTADMAKIYSSLDVLLNPSMGEGFGIPIVEAQACGVPVIVTDWTAMPELCGAGWMVKHTPYWTGLSSWQAVPDIDEIYESLEACYGLKDRERAKLTQTARRYALQYDIRRVAKLYMLPALRIAEQRFVDREPIRIPSRLKAVAA